MPEYLVHLTQDGERWDLLAWDYYGDPFGYERIVLANPGVVPPGTAPPALLPGGLRLLVPVIEAPARPAAGLPPWKRA